MINEKMTIMKMMSLIDIRKESKKNKKRQRKKSLQKDQIRKY